MATALMLSARACCIGPNQQISNVLMPSCLTIRIFQDREVIMTTARDRAVNQSFSGIAAVRIFFLFLIMLFVGGGPGISESATSAGKRATKEERKALYTIFNRNDVAGMKQMLAGGLDINADMGGGVTLLMKAANIGAPEMVALLIRKGAEVNLTGPSGENALLKALSNSRHTHDIVPLLLDAGADVQATNKRNGYNAVWKAMAGIRKGMLREPGTLTLQKLLESGADPNARMISRNKRYAGMTPLMSISQKGFTHIAELLLAYGADPDLATDAGKTAMDFAKEKKRKDIVALLSNFNAGKKDALAKQYGRGATQSSPSPEVLYQKCKDEIRAPWCYQEAVEALGDAALCADILTYWPTANGVHGWCYYQLAVKLQDCSLCDPIVKKDIKRACRKDACR